MRQHRHGDALFVPIIAAAPGELALQLAAALDSARPVIEPRDIRRARWDVIGEEKLRFNRLVGARHARLLQRLCSTRFMWRGRMTAPARSLSAEAAPRDGGLRTFEQHTALHAVTHAAQVIGLQRLTNLCDVQMAFLLRDATDAELRHTFPETKATVWSPAQQSVLAHIPELWSP